MPEFQHSLFGCFSNFGICICTWCLPCYVSGKIAEKVGDSCIVHAILFFVPIANFICLTQIRGKVRDQKGISGSFLTDLLIICFCGGCALCQEAAEMGALDMAQSIPDQEMARE